jgi:hypothetical protein
MARAAPHDTGTDEGLRRRSAALRLKHDVGKAIRWSAPAEAERDIEVLRSRLGADLGVSTAGRLAPSRLLVAFEEWKSEEGALFRGDADLADIEAAMATVRELLPLLATLEERQLRRLDEACHDVQRHCSSLYRRFAAEALDEVSR